MEKYTVKVDNDGNIFWYKENTDILHRLNGPAVEYTNGTKRWFQNGRLHRLDGHAIEWADGSRDYYINHIKLSPKEFLEATQPKKEIKQDSLVSYVGNNEILVCFLSIDEEFQKEKFGPGTNRYLENYDRCVHVELHAGFKLRVGVVVKY